MVFPHHFPHLPGRLFLFSIILIALLLISCSSPGQGISSATSTATSRSSLTPPAVLPSSSQPTSTIITDLAPVKTHLAPTPNDCAIKPPPQQKHLDGLGANTNVRLLGGGAFWFYGSFYQNVLHLSQSDFDPRWPMTKWVVEVGPNYSLPVTLRLRNMQTHVLAWWTDAQTPPKAATQTLILNPHTDTEDVGSVAGVPDIPHGPVGPDWVEWGLFPVFPVAGCYSLEVSWSGGSWQSSMAVGS